MKRTKVITTFEGGQADAQFARRAHEEIAAPTVKTLRNVRVRNAGTARRRPGLKLIGTMVGATRYLPFKSTDGTRYVLAFSNARLDVLSSAGSVLQTLTGCPWGGSDLKTLQFAIDSTAVYVTSRSFWPQTLNRDAAGTWSRQNFVFSSGPGGSTAQPYFRYAPRSTTVQPSTTTGAVVLTANNNVFGASDVGTIIRILGREISISSYTSAFVLNGTWVQTGYPTYRCTVTSTAMLQAGDQVQFSTSKYAGEVYQIVSGTQVDVLMTNSLVGPTVGTDYIIGPSGVTATVTAAAVAATAAATTQWDQQMISGNYGYPGGCCLHRRRLYFYDFRGAPSYIAASAVGAFSFFDVGNATDDDAIVDALGDAPGARIRHLVSREQLIALTTVGSYYVGEGRGTPITPTTIAFNNIGPEPATDCQPVSSAEGVLYPDANADRLMAVAPTGDQTRSWTALELGELAPDLMNSPTRLCLVDGSSWGPERYFMAINADGTLGVMFYRRNGDRVAWSPWDTNGTFIDVVAFDTKVWVCVLRGSTYYLEEFNDDYLLDCSTVQTVAAGAQPLSLSWSTQNITLIWRQTSSGESRRGYMGVFTASALGLLANAPIATASREYEGGRDFTVEIEPWEPYDPVAHTLKLTRISEIAVDLLNSGCALIEGGNRLAPYRIADDITVPPPLRTGTRKKKLLGRRNDLTKKISQTEAAPLEVRSITMVVS